VWPGVLTERHKIECLAVPKEMPQARQGQESTRDWRMSIGQLRCRWPDRVSNDRAGRVVGCSRSDIFSSTSSSHFCLPGLCRSASFFGASFGLGEEHSGAVQHAPHVTQPISDGRLHSTSMPVLLHQSTIQTMVMLVLPRGVELHLVSPLGRRLNRPQG